jgi:hypothetical protein
MSYITECIKNNTPVVYCKYGDGEYFCATKYVKNIQMTENCDNDTYTIKLSNNINKSFKYIVENSNNCLIGRWFSQETLDYWQNLTETPISGETTSLLRDGHSDAVRDDTAAREAEALRLATEAAVRAARRGARRGAP